MNIIKAMHLVGRFPVVQGFWGSASVIIGFLGIIGLFTATLLGFVSDWKIILPMMIVFIVMFVFPIYLPKRKQ